MSQKSPYLIERDTRCQLLYNPQLLHSPNASLLSCGILRQAKSHQQISTGGRGQAWFLEMDDFSAVLRAYQRGGLVAHFNQQTYWGIDVESSRAFKEWRLLQMMLDEGLPVPVPVAASVCRWPFSFSPLYRAHILVERIPASVTLDQLLGKQPPGEGLWGRIGQCIRQFHNAGVFHADLNANNILLDDKQKVYLIDFDKGEFRENQPAGVQWKQDNLQRLLRSLLKQQGLTKKYFYTEQGWGELIAGYNQ